MTRNEFEARVECEFPNQYFFLTVDAWDGFSRSLSRTYAYQKVLLTPDKVQRLPPLSVQRLYMSDYVLSDGKISKDRMDVFREYI